MEDQIDEMPKATGEKPPPLSSVKKLNFKPNPDLKRRLVAVGMSVQHELDQERKLRVQSVDKVLRVIVR